jgi:DNA-binding PadR family transcriptional regulator
MSEVLGGFEHMVLLAMVRLGGSAYSVPIVRELEDQTGRSVAPAAVYVTLRRLEKRALLTSSMVPAGEGEGGRPRRVFRVAKGAVLLLRNARRDLDRLWNGVEALEL